MNVEGFHNNNGFRCCDVEKFEKLNNLSINIFELKFYKDKVKWKYNLIPVRISKNDSNRVVELLLYKIFYARIKNLNVFSGDDHKNFICRRCLNSHTSGNMLKIHKPKCEKYDITTMRTSSAFHLHRLFTLWVIMKNLYKLNMMILVCKQIFSNSFSWNFGALRLDETSFFNTLLGFTSHWDSKITNAVHVDGPGVFTSDKFSSLSTIEKIHSKCDVIDGSVVDGFKQPILFSFVLDKPSVYRVFCEPMTYHYKKLKKSILNTRTFYLKDDENEEIDVNEEVLTSILQMVKV